MMEFNGEFSSPHDRDQLWKYFTDPDVLAEAAPGCKELRLVEPYALESVISVGVGSVRPSFDVEVTILECDEPRYLKMRASGEASRNAFEATASLELEQTDDGGTRAVWSTEADVSGLIASLGQRALGSVADRLVTNFFEDMEAAVEAGEPAESRLEAAPAHVLDTGN